MIDSMSSRFPIRDPGKSVSPFMHCRRGVVTVRYTAEGWMSMFTRDGDEPRRVLHPLSAAKDIYEAYRLAHTTYLATVPA